MKIVGLSVNSWSQCKLWPLLSLKVQFLSEGLILCFFVEHFLCVVVCSVSCVYGLVFVCFFLCLTVLETTLSSTSVVSISVRDFAGWLKSQGLILFCAKYYFHSLKLYKPFSFEIYFEKIKFVYPSQIVI